MSYQKIEKSSWRDFCDRVSGQLEGRPVEIDVIGLDLGDQIAADKTSLLGITYDPDDDAVYVDLELGPARANETPGHIEHVIRAPRELYMEPSENGISQIAILDGDDHKQFVTLRQLVKLPGEVTTTR